MAKLKKSKPNPYAKLKKENEELRQFAAEISRHSINSVEQLEKARKLGKSGLVEANEQVSQSADE